MAGYFLIVLTVFTNAVSSIILKRYSSMLDSENFSYYSVQSCIYIGGAILFFGLSFVFYTYLLGLFPLSKLYALITFGVQIILMVYGCFVLDEYLSLHAILGVSFVAVGLVLIGWVG